jgi:glycine/D-amino acid oxidase-like deaminating enzyme/nitrite reductase/ring-hydroxylating ferredoxin subunit
MEHTNNNKMTADKSIWEGYSAGSSFPSLPGDITTDVAIIGGGITGITTAQLLKKEGLRVTVLEAMRVGAANTGNSTGNLYVAVEAGFDVIQSKYNTDDLRTVVAARQEALGLIAENVRRYSLDCDFKRVNWYSYSVNEENSGKLRKIFDAGKDAGVPITEVMPGELPFETDYGIKLNDQAQFNPLRYIQEMSKILEGDNCRIFENTRVTEIEEDKDDELVKVVTDKGTVYAKYVIHATHTPKGVFLDYHSLLGTYREYGIAAKLVSGDYPEGTFWGYYGVNEKYSIRSYEHEGQKHIVVVGQPHEVGQKENNIENIQNLEKFLHEHYSVSEITHRWGGQNYKPADGLPYIGRKRKGSNVFIATGFSTDGLVYGTLSGIIIRDIITGTENEYTRLFEATRHNPLKAAGNFIKENAINAGEVLKDYIFCKASKLSDISPGEGKVVEVDGNKLAVYNDEKGEMKACSAICTHLGCVVHWNMAERTWDCPCHASRFTTDGDVIEGPALMPLKKIEIEED